MKILATPFLFLLCSLGICFNTCYADMTLTNIDRSVFARVIVCEDISDMESSILPGTFMDDVAVDETDAAGNCQGVASANAFQNTTVSVNSISGTGSSLASYNTGIGLAAGSSFLQIDFNYSTAFNYDLSGTIGGEGANIFENYPGNARVQLLQGSTTLHSIQQTASLVPVTFNLEGTLGPGDFSLIIFANSNGGSNDFMRSDYDFTFNTAPVPEPSSVGIVMLCLGMVGLRRKRLG